MKTKLTPTQRATLLLLLSTRCRAEAARKRINSLAGLLLLLLASMFNLQRPTAQAASGDLDTTFAGTGKTRIGFGGGHAIGYAAAVQADDKLINLKRRRSSADSDFTR